METNLKYINQICVDLGGTGGHILNVRGENEICTLLGGTGGHSLEINALNEICTIQGVTAGHSLVLNALNAIAGVTKVTNLEAWKYIHSGSLLNHNNETLFKFKLNIPDGGALYSINVEDESLYPEYDAELWEYDLYAFLRTLPLINISWGDGITELYSRQISEFGPFEIAHNYESSGEYIVTIYDNHAILGTSYLTELIEFKKCVSIGIYNSSLVLINIPDNMLLKKLFITENSLLLDSSLGNLPLLNHLIYYSSPLFIPNINLVNHLTSLENLDFSQSSGIINIPNIDNLINLIALDLGGLILLEQSPSLLPFTELEVLNMYGLQSLTNHPNLVNNHKLKAISFQNSNMNQTSLDSILITLTSSLFTQLSIIHMDVMNNIKPTQTVIDDFLIAHPAVNLITN